MTVILLLYIYYRKEPEIKATSVTLSLLMFLGCYMILLYLLMAIIYTQSLVPAESCFNICNALLWPGMTGLSLPLILSTLLVKMLRVCYIFKHFGKIGKQCSDGVLLLYVILLMSPNIATLTLWSIFDPYTLIFITKEHPRFTEIIQQCHSKYTLPWLALLYSNIVILVAAPIVVAVKTRKICQVNFKDTKKVNAFMFVLLIVIFMINVQWIILRTTGVKKSYAGIILHLAHIITVVCCQEFLFVPKVLPPLRRSVLGYYSDTNT